MDTPEPIIVDPLKRIHTSCTIDAEVVAQIDKECDEELISRSDVINKVLRRYYGLPETDTKRRRQSIAVSRSRKIDVSDVNQNA